MSLGHIDTSLFLLNYVAKEDRVFLCDKNRKIVSYSILRSTLEYQTAVVREEFETATSILPSIPKEQHNKIAKFLESQGFKTLALSVATDPDLRFELAVELNQLNVAADIMKNIVDKNEKVLERHDNASGISADYELKWKKLGDLALAQCDLDLAQTCISRAEDVSAQLLMSTSMGDAAGLENAAKLAVAKGRTNVAFIAFFLLGKIESCLKLLIDADRVPEAAFMARTYLPSEVPKLIGLWRENLQKVSKRAAESLADPSEYANLFPDMKLALKAEEMFKQRRGEAPVPASKYPEAMHETDLDLIAIMRDMEANGGDIERALADNGAGDDMNENNDEVVNTQNKEELELDEAYEQQCIEDNEKSSSLDEELPQLSGSQIKAEAEEDYRTTDEANSLEFPSEDDSSNFE